MRPSSARKEPVQTPVHAAIPFGAVDASRPRLAVSSSIIDKIAVLVWPTCASIPAVAVWIQGVAAGSQDALEALRRMASPAIADRVIELLRTGHTVQRRRAVSAIHDRLALKIALAEIDPALNSQHLTLSHTALGQPVILGRSDLHVSFSHDGDAHVCLLAQSAELKGVGIDVIHLPRLRGRSDAYLHKFASRFMSEEEYDAFTKASVDETGEPLLRRAAAHFSLMESASKALGTGLKIGAGMGKPTSLRKQAVGATRVQPEVEIFADTEAQARCANLGADRMEGHWSSDGEYGLSAVLLWSDL